MGELDQVLIDNIARAHQYYDAIKSDQTFDQAAVAHNLGMRRLLQIIDLAFLAPDIVKCIMIGEQLLCMASRWLGQNPLSSNWHAKREIIALRPDSSES